jgi:hypothetical protein
VTLFHVANTDLLLQGAQEVLAAEQSGEPVPLLEIGHRALVRGAGFLEAHQLHSALAELNVATVQERDRLLAVVAVVRVGPVRAADVLDDPGAGLPARHRVRARHRRLGHEMSWLLRRPMVIVACRARRGAREVSRVRREGVRSELARPGTNASIAPRPSGGPGAIRSRGICTWLVVSADGLKKRRRRAWGRSSGSSAMQR